jgi:hypothetical protein
MTGVVSVTNGLSGMTEAALGERGAQKTGGVDCRAKKRASEREDLLALQRLHAATRLSRSSVPPNTRGCI